MDIKVISHGPRTITSADGTTISAYGATPAEPRGLSIVVLPDVRGLHPYYADLAVRFSEAAEVVEDLLMLLGGADGAMSEADLEAFTTRLDEREVPYEKHVYDGAPHSFFDRSFDDWQDASADAWTQIMTFTDRYGGRL